MVNKEWASTLSSSSSPPPSSSSVSHGQQGGRKLSHDERRAQVVTLFQRLGEFQQYRYGVHIDIGDATVDERVLAYRPGNVMYIIAINLNVASDYRSSWSCHMQLYHAMPMDGEHLVMRAWSKAITQAMMRRQTQRIVAGSCQPWDGISLENHG
eukprot:gnl/MRDRNA2_/MRDRNA2_79665_c0_seq3.p1 gnl/MRDRNA2_/MRDRNA2_79665_c0~~gnl/MRDRNA2_/MRDRNA2_79665_c0_seq3.p1  ORF type:complete len:154 (+),score=11.32 gnl/MRDRNA2_/MRDRNA2_79665_c0_seq3:64-525(+)